MPIQLERLISIPTFDNSEKNRIGLLLYQFIWSGFLLTMSMIVAGVLIRVEVQAGMILIGGFALVHLLALYLLRRGQVNFTSIFLPAGLWLMVTLLVWWTGGLHGLGFTAYFVVIFLTRLLNKRWTGFVFALATFAASLFILLAEVAGQLPRSILPPTPLANWIAQLAIFAWFGALLFIANRSLDEALARLRHNEQALSEANREQIATRQQLEQHMHALQRRVTQLQVAADVARDAATLREMDVLLNRAADMIRERFGYYHAGIFMVDERGQYAVLKAATGEAGKKMIESGHQLKVGEVGIVGYVAGTGESRIALDVGADAVYFKNPFLPETRSEMALPLRIGKKTIGVLDVQSKEAAAFDEDDVASLQTMADQLAVAIENARLFEATQRQLDELSILHAVAMAGAESTDEDTLIERATQLIGDRLYPDHFGILLLDEDAGVLRFHHSYRGLSDEAKKLALPIGRGISGQVVVHGQPMRVSDVTREQAYVDVHAGMRSELCVPLKVGDRIIGVINAENAQSNYFTYADERLLSTFANQLATAIEKARLFENQRRRAAALETLRQASLHLTSNLEMKAVLDAILSHAIELIHATTAHLFLYNNERLWFGTALWAPGYEKEKPFDQPRPHGVTYTVARSGQPMIITDCRNHPMFYDRPWDGAVISLPIRSGAQVIGVMNLSFENGPRTFEAEEIRVLELLADQAAIALVNARLYTELQERAEELTQALSLREELDRLKNEFIQNVSHELRTPLAIVRGYIELLAQGELGQLTKEQNDTVDIIYRRTNLLSKLVDDLTAILEAESRQVKHEPVNLSEIAQSVVVDFGSAAKQGNLKLIAEIANDLPPLMGNPNHLHRLFDNLIGNAIKFTPSGGTVTVRLYGNGPNTIIEVADTGVGIPSNQLSRIFERFYQVDGSTTRRYGGTGLGLALVKEIVNSHNGEIHVESELGVGTTFRITIPPGQ